MITQLFLSKDSLKVKNGAQGAERTALGELLIF